MPAIPPTISDVTPTATLPNPMEEPAAAVVPVNQLIQTIHIIPQFEVRSILTGLHDGKEIVESLDKDNVITTSQRRLLVRILVSYLIEKFGENPTSDIKKALASGLVESFECLKDSSSSGSEIWYTPGRRQRPATGFLEERLRNVRKRLRSSSTLRSMRQKTPPQMADNGAPARALIPERTISDERASQLKEWLRNNSQPLSQIETYMQNTAVYRAKWIRDNNWTIDQILEEFPHLMTKGMIAQDFLVLHGDAASKLFETWLPIYAEKVLYLARKEGKLTLPLDGLTPDGVGELALRQLPALLPPTTYKVGRGRGVKVVRHTIQEGSLAFIDHKPPGINMVEYLHEAKESKPYPHILTLGNDQSAFQAFVIIAGQALEQETLLQAIDVCFKAFFVFDIKYPKQCEHVWEFIQTVIYEIPGGESKIVKFIQTRILACK